RLSVVGAAALDQRVDIAIIKVGWWTGQSSARYLDLAEAEVPPIGTKVYAIGNPKGFANTLSDGLVSGHRSLDRIAMIQTTAPISPGSSGGPLLGPDAKVVGVTTAIFKGGQNLNFAVPVSHVAKLLVQCEGQGQLTPLPLPQRTPVERGEI